MFDTALRASRRRAGKGHDMLGPADPLGLPEQTAHRHPQPDRAGRHLALATFVHIDHAQTQTRQHRQTPGPPSNDGLHVGKIRQCPKSCTEVEKSFPQERSPERMCEQRTVEQSLDNIFSESFLHFREKSVNSQGKERRRKILRTHHHW